MIMKKKRTELFIDKNPDKISKVSTITTLGAHFSNLMAEQLIERSFNVANNPFGNIYNPISVFNAIQKTLKNEPLNEDLITEVNGEWSHYDFHFSHNSNSREELVQNLKATITETNKILKKTDFLILTFGSAFVYKLSSTNHIVANCHKTPTNHFNKTLLTPAEIVKGFRSMYSSLNHVKNIILVVSPIYQALDSQTLNAVSKSVLRIACHQIMSEFPYVKYFPGYEFLTSDLRGYENYEDDLITPNKQAMEYVFAKFDEAYSEK